jgi:hypothetical protein
MRDGKHNVVQRKQECKSLVQKEIGRISYYCQDLVLKELGRKTFVISPGLVKTSNGYVFYRKCIKSKFRCESTFNFYINIHKRETTISYNRICEHKFKE